MVKDFTPWEIVWDDEKAGRLWNYYAGNDGYQGQYFSYHSGKFIISKIKKYVDFQGDILDFGCGPGHLVPHLLDVRGAGKIFCMDFSSSSIEKVGKRFQGHPGFGGAIWAKSLPSELPDKSMDLILCVEVIEHLQDDQLSGLLREAHRLLRDKGKLVITTPNKENLEGNKTICPECGCIFHRWQHVRSFTTDQIDRLLRLKGFRPVVIRSCFFQPWHHGLVGFFKRVLGRLRRRILPEKPHLLAIATKA